MAYLPLSTANLPDPVIDPAQGASPEDYFGTLLFTATAGVADSVTGLGFAPDFSWTKARNAAQSHQLFDNVRGDGVRLITNSTAAESDLGATYVSLEDDGIDYGSSTFSSNTYVAWNWKANGSGVSNTDGSIPSTVSANTTSGFSIVSYTGNGSTGGETYGHGLNQPPELIITKARTTNSLNNWPTWHKSLNANSLVYLNATVGQVVETGWMPTLPSNTLVYLGTGNTSRELTNNSGVDYIAYCFHSVDGFSKFGSYVGNGSADGTFVYTGFRPAFVLFKKTNITTASWAIRDNTRYTYNPTRNTLYPDKSDAEYTGTAHDIDFLSNGFKPRTTDGLFNSSGATYIYMAFAENPFKFSTAS